MPNTKSAIRRVRRVTKQTAVNRLRKSKYRAAIKKMEDLIKKGEKDKTKNFDIIIKDEGPGFSEISTDKIFKRFYSNRPTKFGEHSGLGLNIVKNIVELHKGRISASNRVNQKGAQIEVILPKSS